MLINRLRPFRVRVYLSYLRRHPKKVFRPLLMDLDDDVATVFSLDNIGKYVFVPIVFAKLLVI